MKARIKRAIIIATLSIIGVLLGVNIGGYFAEKEINEIVPSQEDAIGAEDKEEITVPVQQLTDEEIEALIKKARKALH